MECERFLSLATKLPFSTDRHFNPLLLLEKYQWVAHSFTAMDFTSFFGLIKQGLSMFLYKIVNVNNLNFTYGNHLLSW